MKFYPSYLSIAKGSLLSFFVWQLVVTPLNGKCRIYGQRIHEDVFFFFFFLSANKTTRDKREKTNLHITSYRGSGD